MSNPTRHNGIIVGVDGSAPSKVAVDWAAREASLRELPLTIIYISPSPMVAADIPMPVNLTERLEKHGQSVLREARSTAEDAVEGSRPITIDTEMVRAAILPTLIDRSKDADMIVVGCRGLGAIGRRLLGSVSSGFLHHAHCPVAVIHDEDPMMPHPSEAPVVVGHRRFAGFRARRRRSPSKRRRAAALTLSPFTPGATSGDSSCLRRVPRAREASRGDAGGAARRVAGALSRRAACDVSSSSTGPRISFSSSPSLRN